MWRGWVGWGGGGGGGHRMGGGGRGVIDTFCSFTIFCYVIEKSLVANAIWHIMRASIYNIMSNCRRRVLQLVILIITARWVCVTDGAVGSRWTASRVLPRLAHGGGLPACSRVACRRVACRRVACRRVTAVDSRPLRQTTRRPRAHTAVCRTNLQRAGGTWATWTHTRHAKLSPAVHNVIPYIYYNGLAIVRLVIYISITSANWLIRLELILLE